MAKKQPIVGICSECAHGKPDTQWKNLSLMGQPTLVICPFTEYKHVVSEPACNLFSKRQNCTTKAETRL